MLTPSLFGSDDLVVRKLDAVPPPGFDCGRGTQTHFLYDHAWHDQLQSVSVTYVYRVERNLAAYTTICMDAIPLGTRERPSAIRYKETGALKLAQLGVDRSFQGRGFGTMAVAYVISRALQLSLHAGCRYVTLDARPDLVEWYRSLGFVINGLKQKQRLAAAPGKNPDEIPVSMRFDLREV